MEKKDWIPVSALLPLFYSEVLVTLKDDGGLLMSIFDGEKFFR